MHLEAGSRQAGTADFGATVWNVMVDPFRQMCEEPTKRKDIRIWQSYQNKAFSTQSCHSPLPRGRALLRSEKRGSPQAALFFRDSIALVTSNEPTPPQ